MFQDELRRACGAMMAAARFRVDGYTDTTPTAEDASIAELVSKVMSPSDLAKACHDYVDEMAAIFDIENRIGHVPSFVEKVRLIGKTLRNATDRKATTYDGYTKDHYAELTCRDLNVIQTLAGKVENQVTSASPVATTATKPAFKAMGTINYDPAALRIADATIRQATKGAFSSAEQMIRHINAAEAEIITIHSVGSTVGATVVDPEYVMVEKNARDVFASSCSEALEPNDLNFTVSVFEWKSRHPKIPNIRPHYMFSKDQLTDLLWSIENGKNVALVGPTGCGKTIATEQLAARLGRPFYRVPVDGQMRKRDLLGGYTQVVQDGASATVWYKGILEQALEWPSIIDLDEFDRADPDIQYIAHQLYEGEGLTILEDGNRFIRPHNKVSILATANTKGRSDGMNIYSLQQEMSEATRDRFPLWLDFDYMPEDSDRALLLKEVPDLDPMSAEKIAKVAVLLRNAFKLGTLRTACSYRQLHTCAQYAAFQQKMLKDNAAARVRAIRKILVNRGGDETEVMAMAESALKVLGTEWEAHQ